jgi:hypothetical protein
MKNIIYILFLTYFLSNSYLYSQENQWKQQLVIDGGAAVPFSKYTDIYKLKTGYGFSGIYYVKFNNKSNVFFSASVGHYFFKGELWQNPGFSNSLDVIPIQLGLKNEYNLIIVRPYWGIEAGIFIMKTVSDMNDEGKTIIKEYSFGFTPKFGVKYPIFSNFELDANLKIIYVIYHEIGIIQTYNHGQLGINLGFAYTF